MSCLLISRDLLFVSQVVQTARSVSLGVDAVADMDSLVAALARPEVRHVVVDLNDAQLDPVELSTVGAQRPLPLDWLAVGPHVHKGRLDAARRVGWNVLTRGQFHAAAAEIFREWAGDSP